MSLRATPRLTCLKCWLLPAIVLAGGVWAQPGNYPDKPVRIISDAAPGGAIDTNLRIIAEGLSKEWAQQVVIENRPGAGGAISATAAAEAPPDGYTIYAPALSVFLTIPGKAPNLPLELPRDFTAIGITAVQPQSIGINPKLGINSLPELIAQAKKLPGSISYAVTGVGRLTHLTGELLQIRGNFKLQMVPYTGGSAQSLADVTAGRVTLVIEGYAGLAGAYESGQLKALAVASEKRLPHLPDLPTVAETLPGLSPSAGSAWWRRLERQTRSCARSATICAQCLSNRRSRISLRHAAPMCIRPPRPKPRHLSAASKSYGSQPWSR